MRRFALTLLTTIAVLAVSLGVAAPATGVTTTTISGTMSRTGGTPGNSMFVYLIKQGSSGTRPFVKTAIDGSWSFDVPTAGSYTLKFEDDTSGSTWANEYWSDQYAFSLATYFTINAGDHLSGYDATLVQGGSITVHVVGGPSQTPVSNATVIFSGGDVLHGTDPQFVATDALGNVTVTRLAPGAWIEDTSADGYSGEWYNDWDSSVDSNNFDRLTFTEGSVHAPISVWLNTFAASTTYFQDVPTESSFYASIQWTADQGISTGTPVAMERPLYKPVDAVSRQAMAAFLFREQHAMFTPPVDPSFADVPTTNPFYQAIEWMKAEGISTGTPQGAGLKPLFNPTDPVSRQAMALFLSRTANGMLTPPVTPDFADVPTTSTYYPAIEWMFQNGISTGTPNPVEGEKPLYKPLDPVTRQAMALFLFRFSSFGTT